MANQVNRPSTTPSASSPTTPATRQPPKTASPDFEKAVKVVSALHDVKKLLQNVPEISDIFSLYDKNKALEAKLAENQRDRAGLLRQISDLIKQQDTDTEQLREAEKEAEKLRREIKALKDELNASHAAQQGKEAELSRIRNELSRDREQLNMLGNYAAQPVPLDQKKQEFTAGLNQIFTLAKELAETCLGVDLGGHILQDDKVWDVFRDHAALRASLIALPTSNTPIAKQMRIGAFLRVLAHELSHHIFLPSYLVPQNSPLNKILYELAKDDPDHEVYVRSVLLCLDNCCSDSLRSSIIKTLEDNVARTVSGLIPVDRKNDFDTQLRNLCNTAFELWQRIQSSYDRIDLVPPVHDAIRARPLFGNSNNNNINNNSSRPRANGTSQPSGQSKKGQPNTTTDTTSTATTSTFPLSESAVIWPGFYNLAAAADADSSGHPELLVAGYLLTAEQLALGRAEERARKSSLTGASGVVAETTGLRREKRSEKRRAGSLSTHRKSGMFSGAWGGYGWGAGGCGDGAGGSAVGQSGLSVSPTNTSLSVGTAVVNGVGGGSGKGKGGAEDGGGGSGGGKGTDAGKEAFLDDGSASTAGSGRKGG